MLTNKERQKNFKAKMYKNGFKQMIVWVKRQDTRVKKMGCKEFIVNMKKLSNGWDEADLSRLYVLLIKIVKGKKEARKLKEKE